MSSQPELVAIVSLIILGCAPKKQTTRTEADAPSYVRDSAAASREGTPKGTRPCNYGANVNYGLCPLLCPHSEILICWLRIKTEFIEES